MCPLYQDLFVPWSFIGPSLCFKSVHFCLFAWGYRYLLSSGRPAEWTAKYLSSVSGFVRSLEFHWSFTVFKSPVCPSLYFCLVGALNWPAVSMYIVEAPLTFAK